jgi:hypothetical protein
MRRVAERNSSALTRLHARRSATQRMVELPPRLGARFPASSILYPSPESAGAARTMCRVLEALLAWSAWAVLR